MSIYNMLMAPSSLSICLLVLYEYEYRAPLSGLFPCRSTDAGELQGKSWISKGVS